MNLYIKLENGQPINHPLFEDNILQCYPNIDLSNTDLFVPFIRLQVPYLPKTELQVIENKYVYDANTLSYTDSYYIRDMNQDEIVQTTNDKINSNNAIITSLTDNALQELVKADEIDKPIWHSYLDSLYDLTLYSDPFKIVFPRPPKKDSTGNLVSLQSSGSKPNVIG